MKTNHFLSLAVVLCISLLSSCTSDIELPPPPPENPSSSAGETWSYCVYVEMQQCFPGAFYDCPSGGLLGNSCPFEGQSSSSQAEIPRSSSSSLAGQSSSSNVAVPEYGYCVFVEDRTCLSGALTSCPPGGALSNSCPYNPSSSSKPSSSSFIAASSSSSVAIPSSSSVPFSSSIVVSSSSILPPSSSSRSSSSAASGGSGDYCFYGPNNCHKMPVDDNCKNGTLTNNCSSMTAKYCNYGTCVNGNGWNCDSGGCYPQKNGACDGSGFTVVDTCPSGTKPPSADY